MLGITSCFPTHYFDPEIGDTSKVERFPTREIPVGLKLNISM